MKPAPFTYHRPRDVESAARLLAQLGERAKVIAGGQSLVPLMNFRLADPENLVDVNAVGGLDELQVAEGAVEVGATVRVARLLSDPEVRRGHPLLTEAAGWIAHAVIRNRGTVGGSLAHADPAAELPAVLALLDGSVEVVAWRSDALARRRVAAAELFVGPLDTTLETDELVVGARFPRLGPRTGWAMDELARRHGDYAIAGVALTVTVDGHGAPEAGRAAYLSCAPTPVVVDLGPALAGGEGDTRVLYDLVSAGLDPTDDIHATGEYRRHLAATLTVRAVGRAVERARAAGATATSEVTA